MELFSAIAGGLAIGLHQFTPALVLGAIAGILVALRVINIPGYVGVATLAIILGVPYLVWTTSEQVDFFIFWSVPAMSLISYLGTSIAVLVVAAFIVPETA